MGDIGLRTSNIDHFFVEVIFRCNRGSFSISDTEDFDIDIWLSVKSIISHLNKSTKNVYIQNRCAQVVSVKGHLEERTVKVQFSSFNCY